MKLTKRWKMDDNKTSQDVNIWHGYLSSSLDNEPEPGNQDPYPWLDLSYLYCQDMLDWIKDLTELIQSFDQKKLNKTVNHFKNSV